MPATISGIGSSSLLTLKLLFIRHLERYTVKHQNPNFKKIRQKTFRPANFSNFGETAKNLIINGKITGCRRLMVLGSFLEYAQAA